MNDTVIQIHNLGKRYEIGTHANQHQTLPEVITEKVGQLTRWVGRPGRSGRNPGGDFWALRHVGFDVQNGEVIGIVGRNGAGKSTLLKILSQITDPTEGSAIIRGRVASLLEVGTGFHPELTGRENIYLNGSILGMTRREIKAKFNQIVEFSGIRKFLDTPIKRYSSGMTVRLAFSVAAHLEPEILVIDEVLAVGDAQFQKKCLGKMGEVARGGRTVLFVSHNLAAVSSLCSRCVLLRGGRTELVGDTAQVIQRYQASFESAMTVPLTRRTDRRGDGRVRFTRVAVQGERGDAPETQITSGTPLSIEIGLMNPDHQPTQQVHLTLVITDTCGKPLFSCCTKLVGQTFDQLPGQANVVCSIPRLPLAPNEYRIDLWAAANGREADYIQSAGKFTVMQGDFYGTWQLPVPRKHGAVLVDHQWSVERTPNDTDPVEAPRLNPEVTQAPVPVTTVPSPLPIAPGSEC